MQLTQQIRIFPTLEQEEVLWVLSEKCRLIYNFALAERRDAYKNVVKGVTYRKQQNDLPIIKEQYPEYKWVYSKVLQQCVKKLDEDFKSFFSKWKKGDKTAHPPKYKGKQYFTTLCYNQSGFKLSEKDVRFSHKHPSRIPLKFAFTHPVITKGKIKQVEVKRYQNSEWFIYITREVKPPDYNDNGLYYAIDLGVSNLMTGINLHLKSKQIKNRRVDFYWKKKISEVQSKRDHCKKGSHRWLNYNTKLLKMKQKCAAQMKDYQHFIANKVVRNTKAKTIIVGDISAKQMVMRNKYKRLQHNTTSNKTLNYSLQNTGSIGRFVEFLTYKAERIGKRLIRIDESHTSQTCCVCGKVHRMPLSRRMMNCDCGNRMDRDINSAVNIMSRFLRNKSNYVEKYDFLSQKPSMTEESFLKRLDLLRYTAPSLSLTGDGGLAVS